VWGSDYGFGAADPVGYRLALLRQAQIDPDLCERILGHNPFRLLDAAAG
jgi:hypothetical protein